MTRKQLEDLGLSKEQMDSVMKINGEDIRECQGSGSRRQHSVECKDCRA